MQESARRVAWLAALTLAVGVLDRPVAASLGNMDDDGGYADEYDGSEGDQAPAPLLDQIGMAVGSGDAKLLAELLTDLEADTVLNAVTDEGGMTPLMLASHFGFVELVYMLLAHMRPESVRHRTTIVTGEKGTALEMVVDGWSWRNVRQSLILQPPEDVMELLAKSGARVDHEGTIKLLISAGADPTAGEESAIELALQWRVYAALPALLDGADCARLGPMLAYTLPRGKVDRSVVGLVVGSGGMFRPLCRALFDVVGGKGESAKLMHTKPDGGGDFMHFHEIGSALLTAVRDKGNCDAETAIPTLDLSISTALIQLAGAAAQCGVTLDKAIAEPIFVDDAVAGTTGAGVAQARFSTVVHEAVHCGDRRTLSALIALGAPLDRPDWLGRTPLHVAALESHFDLAELLALQTAKLAGTDRTAAVAALLAATDVLGRSPMDYEPRFQCLTTVVEQPCDFRIRASKTATELPPEALALLGKRWPTKGETGWRAYPAGERPPLLLGLPDGHCDFVELDGAVDYATFFNISDGWAKPVIIRGGTAQASAMNWTLLRLKQLAGSQNITSGVTPYAADLGREGAEGVSLRQFVTTMLTTSPKKAAQGKPPNYAFDNDMHDKLSMMEPVHGQAFFEDGFQPGPPFADIAQAVWQFMLGPVGSGAPPHEHTPAINALFVGRKRWALFPPARKLWARDSALEWFQQPGSLVGAHQCVQGAGDLLFVPNMWAHAVLNVEDVVATAIELDMPQDIPSMSFPSAAATADAAAVDASLEATQPDRVAAEIKQLKAARRAADDADDEDEVERLSGLIQVLKAKQTAVPKEVDRLKAVIAEMERAADESRIDEL